MLPILLRVDFGGTAFRLGAYSFLIFCGALAALLIVLRRAKEARLSPRSLLPVFTVAVVAGFLGARLGAFLQTGTGGFVLYAGFIAAFLSGLLAARWKGLPALEVADLAAPCALLAAAFGRLGCLLAGCCYGVVHEGGLAYPAGSHAFNAQVRQGLVDARAPESLPTAPIALCEAAALLVFFVVTSALWKRRLKPGSVLGIAGLLYAAWRYVAEYGRADNAPYWPGGLTFSQGISLAVLATGVALLCRGGRRPAALPAAALPFRPASALQVLLLLASVGLSLGGVSCASHGNSDARSASGTHVYRKANADNNAPDPKKDSDSDSNGWFSDCVSDCLSDCIESCADAVCEEACSEDSSGEASATDSPPPQPLNKVLAALKPGAKYKGSLRFEVAINQRLNVYLKLEGTLSAGKEAAGGVRPVTLRLRRASLEVGDARWTGSGDLDLQVGPDSDVQIVRSTLPAEFMDALASLNAVAGNLLAGATTEHPLTDLQKVVQEELADPRLRAGFSVATTFAGRETWTVGEAKVVQNPPGTYKLFWRVSY